MNKFFAQCIDNFALYQLHKERSQQSHFIQSAKAPVSINELHSFYSAPMLPRMTFQKQETKNGYNIGWYSYKSQIENGPSNKYSTGLNYENTLNNQQLKFTAGGWIIGIKSVISI